MCIRVERLKGKAVMKYLLLAVSLFAFSSPNVLAQSRIVGLQNTYNEYMDDFRKADTQKDRCHYVDLTRSYAQMIMEEGDASRAKDWNRFFPQTGCSATRLIIDPSATKQSSNPEPTQGFSSQVSISATGACLPFQEIMTIDVTREIQASCPGGGFIFIKAD